MSVLDMLLTRYQVRRNARQKAAFFQYASAISHSAGYPCRVEELKSGLTCRNIIAGDPEKARVIFTAHYDTCAQMLLPNLIYPQSRGKTVLAQMPLILICVLAALLFGALAERFLGRTAGVAAAYIVYLSLFGLNFFGPANPHTANDNTSGVAALLEIMTALSGDQNAAFIFFDQEEMGKVGSKAYAKAHPGLTQGKVLLNLDCVGHGDDFLVIQPKNSDAALDRLLRAAFPDENGKRAIHYSARNTNYNSDQKSFENGAAVAACRNGRWGFHVPRIHTRQDTVCEQSNLDYVRACSLRLMNEIKGEKQ